MGMRRWLIWAGLLILLGPSLRADEEGFVRLFAAEGVPAGWSVRAWNDLAQPAEGETAWKVVDGILQPGQQRGTWLVSAREYDDFILEFEIKLTEYGNSGVALRAPLEGDPAFDGMELQFADLRYNPQAKESELTGGIYRAIAPSEQVYRPTEWNHCRIELVQSRLRVTLNGEIIQDLDLASFDQQVPRHDGSLAPPIKDRPRRGHLGFQHLSRNNEPIFIRNVRIKESSGEGSSEGELCGESWPQWRGPNRDGVWSETGLRDRFEGAEITPRWRVEISSGYSGPTVADGRVFVTDRLVEPEETERIHCFDWRTGEQLWSIAYPCSYAGIGYTAGPRASVLVEEDRAYSLGGAGHLHCVATDSGEILWKRDLREEYDIRMPNWGIAASPLIEGDLVILQIGGAGDACMVALDKHTGQSRWQSLPDDATYSAPVVIDQGGRRVLVCWTGNRVAGLAPESGELLWEFPFKAEQWPIAIATPVIAGDRMLFSEAHQGSLLLRAVDDPLSVEKLWHRRSEDGPALHSLISTPLIIDGYIYGADGEGILRCLDLETGQQVWQDDSAVETQQWATIHLVRNADRVWMFNEQGELIIAKLSPEGFEEISRSRLIDPTTEQLRRRDGVTWAHPAFAYRHVFARNDKELVCADLSAD